MSWLPNAMDEATFTEPYFGTWLIVNLMDNPGTWTVAGAEVPEPASLGLLGIGAAAYAGARRRRRPAA